MPGEKQNSLQQKLEQLSAVPKGFCFNQEQAWQKMEPQLRSDRKSILWVPAAAILLTFFTGYFFMRSHTQRSQPATAIVQNSSKPIKQNAPIAARVSLQKTITVFKIKVALNNVKASPPVIDVQELPVMLSAQLLPLETPVRLLLPPPIDTMITASLPAKPRFKIAHVNELNTLPADAPEATKKSFAFSLRHTSPVTSDEALPANDNPVVQRKPRTLFSTSLNASQ